MSGRTSLILGFLLAIAAAVLFFHRSGTVCGYQEDFVSLALNGYCVAVSGSDEYGERYPLLAFRSFGDYKSTLNLYLAALTVRLFDARLETMRRLSLVLSFGGSLVALLVAGLGGAAPPPRWRVVGGAAFAMWILSPWLLVPHRLLVEVSSMYFVLALATAGTFWLLRRPESWTRGLVSGVCVGLLAYCYSPAKVVYVLHGPILAGAYGSVHGLRQMLRSRGLRAALLAWLLAGLPFAWDALHQRRTLARFEQVQGHFLLTGNTRSFLANCSYDFLFATGDRNPHHHIGRRGELNLFFLPWLLAGAGSLVALRPARDQAFWRYALLLLPVGFVPATLALHSEPHALRTNLAIVPVALVSLYGLSAAARWLDASPTRLRWGALIIAIWCAVGLRETARDLEVFFGSWARRPLWSYTRPKPRWNLAAPKLAYSEHGPETVHERYYRAVVRGDLGYCAGTQAVRP